MTVTLLSEQPGDEEFLRRLVLETIAIELHAEHWPEAIRGPLLETQHRARRHGVTAGFPGGDSRIILVDGDPAGWIYTAPSDDQVWLAEFMVLPERRGQGVGSAALRQVLSEAAGKPVRLTVNQLNHSAIRLYVRLGFRRTGGDAVQHYMEHTPA
jgi:ribosomal protein S18 acetylase RimI-like enzyme